MLLFPVYMVQEHALYPYEPLAKLSFCPTSGFCYEFYPWNINYMPVVKFFGCLDFEQKIYFCKRLVYMIIYDFKISRTGQGLARPGSRRK